MAMSTDFFSSRDKLGHGQFKLIAFLLIFLHGSHVGGQLECDVVQGAS